MTTEQYAIPGLKNVLYIDLTSRSYYIKDRRDLYEKYFGGVGVATNLMLEEYIEGTGPLDPEMPIILSTGPLSGVYPTCTKKPLHCSALLITVSSGSPMQEDTLPCPCATQGTKQLLSKVLPSTLCMWQFITIRLFSGTHLPYGIFLQQLTWEKSSEM